MKRNILCAISALLIFFSAGLGTLCAQQGPSTYADGDSLAALVKMKYVYTLEEALRLSRETKKPIFFNAFADWARPCHGMNGMVFSNENFCKWMDKNFVCLFMDVSKRENHHLAERYGISSWAHYLVIDQQGEIIHRIVGGAPLPTFQEKLSAALNPQTSLRGTTEAYNKGNRSKKLLLAYVTALHDAGQDSLYKEILPQYENMLTESDYLKKENWFIVRQKAGQGLDCEMCRFVIANRAKFNKAVSSEEVDELLNQLYVNHFFNKITSYDEKATAAGSLVEINPSSFTDDFLAMQNTGIPDSLSCYTFYKIAKAYCLQHDYEEVLRILPTLKDIQIRTMVEISLKYPEPTLEQRAALISYYRERESRYKEVRSSYGRAYEEIVNSLEKPTAGIEGIVFASGSLNDALAQAKTEGKMVFVDCYTSWCGPCKMLAKQTFPDKSVGNFFNPRFVSLQIDMEKGEGVELAKRWGVDAYPTMIVLDADGNVKGRIVGFLRPQQILDEMGKVLNQQ